MHSRYLQCWRVPYLLLFLTHVDYLCNLLNVRLSASLLVFLSSGQFRSVLPSSILRMVPSILQEWEPKYLSLFKIPAVILGFEKFSFLSFLLAPFIWGNLLPIFPSTGKFPFFPSALIVSWFRSSVPSVICLFPLFIIIMAHFSHPTKFHLYMLTVYS